MVNIMDFKTWFSLPTGTSSLAAGSEDFTTSSRGKDCDPRNECFKSNEVVEKEGQIAAKSPLATTDSPKICPNVSEASITTGSNESKGSFTVSNHTDHDYFQNWLKSTKSMEKGNIINPSSPKFNIPPMIPADLQCSPIGSEMSSVNSETLFLPPAITSSLVSASGEKEEASTAPQTIDHFKKSWFKSTKIFEKEEEKISPVMTPSSNLDNALSPAAERNNEGCSIVLETAGHSFSGNKDDILEKHHTNADSASHFWASVSGAIGKKTKRKDIPYYSVIHHEKPSHTLTKPMRKLFKKKIWSTRKGGGTEKRSNSEPSNYDDGPSFSSNSKMENVSCHRHFRKREYAILALKEAVGKKGYLSSIDIDKQIDFINRNHKIRRWKNRDSQASGPHHIVGICEPWELNQPIVKMQSNDSLDSLIILQKRNASKTPFHKDPSPITDHDDKNKMSGREEARKPLAAILPSHTSLRTKKIFNIDSSDSAIASPRFSPIQPVSQKQLRDLGRESIWSGGIMYKNENDTAGLSFQKNFVPQNTLSADKRRVNASVSQQCEGEYPVFFDQEASQEELVFNSPFSPKLKASCPLSSSFSVPNRKLYVSHQNDNDNSSIVHTTNDGARHLPYYHHNQVFDASASPNLRAPFPYIPPDFQSAKLPRVETNAFVFDIDVQQIVEKLVSSRKASTLQSHRHESIRRLSGISSSGLVPNSEQNIGVIGAFEHSEESISSSIDIEDHEFILPKRRSTSDNILKSVPNVEESFVEGSSSCYDLSENQLISTDHDMEGTQPSFQTVIHHPLRSISADAISLSHDYDLDISALKLSNDEEQKNGKESPSFNIGANVLPQKKNLRSLFDAANSKNQENLMLLNTGHHVIMSTLLAADAKSSVPADISSDANNMEDIITINRRTSDSHVSLSKYVDDRNEDGRSRIKHQDIPNARVKSMQASTASAEKLKSIPAYRLTSSSSVDICETPYMPKKSFDQEIPGQEAYGNNRNVKQELDFDGALNDGLPGKGYSSLPTHLLHGPVNIDENYLISTEELFEDAKNTNKVTDSRDNSGGFESSPPQRIPSFVHELFGEKECETETPDKNYGTPLPPNVERPIILVEEEPNAEKLFVVNQDPLDSPCLVHWPVEEENWFAKILGEYCPSRFRNNERFNYDSYGFKVKQYYMTTRALLQDRYKTCSKVVFAPRPDKWLNFEMEKDYLDEIDDFIRINKNLYPLFKGPRIVRRKHMIRRWMNRKRDRQIIMEQLMEYWRRDPHIIDRLKWERQILKPFPTEGASLSHTASGDKPRQCPGRPSLKLIASRIFQRMTMDLAHKRLGRPPRNGSSVIMLRKGPPLGIDYFGYKRDKAREWAHDFLLSL